MYRKIYECVCDYCHQGITHWHDRKPTKEELEEIGAVVDGPHIFCDEECRQEYRHYVTVTRCGNLKQFQPGKKFERK